jgi:uncharacterized integral membrane protein
MTYTEQGGENAPHEAQAHQSTVGFGAILSLVGGGLLLVFVLQNTKSIDVDFLFWTVTWPLWFLIVVSALLGALTWFGMGVVRRHRRRALRRANRRG